MTGFLDEMVRGRAPAQPVAPVRMFLMGANEWLDLPAWPPPGSAERIWYLDSDGGATSRFGDGRLGDVPPPAGAPADEWVHDPDRPVPFITAASSAQIGGPDDFAGVETRGDVLVFTSEAADRAARRDRSRCGWSRTCRPRLPTPTSRRSCSTCIRTASRSGCVTDWSGSATAAGTSGYCRSSPARVYEVVVEMWDTAQRFQPGHRIRVEIASSAHPKFAVNLGHRRRRDARDRGRGRPQRAAPRRRAPVAAGADRDPAALTVQGLEASLRSALSRRAHASRTP